MPGYPQRLRTAKLPPWRPRPRRRLGGGAAPSTAGGPTVTQEGFRWRNDDGSETGATWKAAQDTNTSTALATNVRLRTLLDAAGDPNPAAYTLHYKKTSDSTWLPVPVGAGGSAGGPVGYRTFDGVDDVLRMSYGSTVSDSSVPLTVAWVWRMLTDKSGAVMIAADASGAPVYDPIDIWRKPNGAGGGEAHRFVAYDGGSNYDVGVTANVADGWALIVCTRNAGTSGVGRWSKATYSGSAWSSFTHTNGSASSATRTFGGTGTFYLFGTAEAGEWLHADVCALGIWEAALTTTQIATLTTDLSAWTTLSPQHLFRLDQTPVVDLGAAGSTQHSIVGTTVTSTGAPLTDPVIPGNPVYVVTSSNVTAGGQNTTAQLSAPAGKTTGDFRTGRMWDDENGLETLDLGESEANIGSFTETFTNLNKWTAARQRSAVQSPNSPGPIGYLQDFGPSLVDNVVPPNDVIVSSGQVWIGCGAQNYGDTYIRCNQPFYFISGGTIEVDAWIPVSEALQGWPHIVVTDLPYTAPSAKKDNSNGPTAQYGFDVRLNRNATSGHPTPEVLVWDEHAETEYGSGGVGLSIVTTPHTMTNVRIEFTHSHIDIYADDVLWYASDWTLPPELTSGYVYLGSHNHASKKYTPYPANMYAVYDNFTLSDTFALRRCWPAPDNVATIAYSDADIGTAGVDIGYVMPATVTVPSVPAGVTAARLLCTTTCYAGSGGVTASTSMTYALNGNTPHTEMPLPEWNGTSPGNTGVNIWSLPLNVSELVTGSNSIAFSMSGTMYVTPFVTNVQILTEGGA